MSNTDPVLKRLKRVRILIIVAAVFIVIGLILLIIDSIFGHGTSSVPLSRSILNYVVMMISFLLVVASTVLITRYYTKAQQQRTTAIQGGVPGPVAAEQPIVTGSVPLTLPFTLSFHANWRYFLFLLILPIIVILAIGSVLIYVFILNQPPYLSVKFASVLYAIAGGMLLLFVVTMGIGLWFSARRLRQYIEVSEQGVKGRFFGQENDLRWDEIKLFALWGGKSKAMHAYEVAGERGMVRWTVPVKNRWYSTVVSTLPFEEYYPQMQDVLVLIAAKTDLPLRDLRLKWYGGKQKQNQEQQQVSNVG